MSEKSIVAERSQDGRAGICDGVGAGIVRSMGDVVLFGTRKELLKSGCLSFGDAASARA
jgi:hypothetical protein